MFKESVRLVVWLVPIILLAVIILPQMIRILREYERGVIFRLGKLLGTKGPGLILLIPIVDRMVRMHLRVVTIDVARQEVMTRDNVPVSTAISSSIALRRSPKPGAFTATTWRVPAACLPRASRALRLRRPRR
jgi:regulator of protease activity HflC (stomatin/prohibitin superfamily)